MFHLLFSLFVLFLALSFFGISIEQIINSPAGQANIAYLSTLLSSLTAAAWHWLLLQVR